MSGHSHWATIKRKKGAADAKRGQAFTRLAREIALAAREGADPSFNFRLALAVEKARDSNMPKDNIERAVQRGSGQGKDGVQLEEVYYEGYAPHGVAVMISCVTENRNRTVADLRHILSRYGGSLAEAGSVGWQFTRKAYFTFPSEDQDFEKVFEIAVEAGADDVTEDDGQIEIIGAVESFKDINDLLRSASITPEEAGLKMVPNNEIELSKEDTVQVLKVIDAIEEIDDVQDVYSNLSVSAEAWAQFEEA